jgi:hypothetical protein
MRKSYWDIQLEMVNLAWVGGATDFTTYVATALKREMGKQHEFLS